ncbi:MAG: HAD family phosphatase [Propionicimonas sp.]
MAAGAVIFDMDGVLADSEPVHLAAERAMLAEYGHHLTTVAKRPFIGLSGDDIMQGLIALFDIDSTVETMAAAKASHQRALIPEMGGFAVTDALVRRLAAASMPIAVASGSEPGIIDASLDAVGLGEFFEVRVSADEVPLGKPAPDVFLEAARRLGVSPDSCVVIEDAVPGVAAALAAGMRCVAIPTVTEPLDPIFARAHLLFPAGMGSADVDAILDFILGS